jgi:hypothetical protein
MLGVEWFPGGMKHYWHCSTNLYAWYTSVPCMYEQGMPLTAGSFCHAPVIALLINLRLGLLLSAGPGIVGLWIPPRTLTTPCTARCTTPT